MKKKVFSLMMTLLLAFVGVAKADLVEVGVDGSTTTNSYLPCYSLYNNTLSQQLYTADEIGTAGTINSIAFYNGGTEKSPLIKIYMVNTSKSEFASTTDWITAVSEDKVFEGTVTFTAGDWTTITLDTPFAYDGTSNLGLIVDANLAWSSGLACRVFTGTSNCSMYVYSDPTDYDALNPSSYTANNRLNVKNQLQLEMTISGGGGQAGLVALQDGEVVETITVGARPNGCWMEPFRFSLRNDGPATNVTDLDFTPHVYFTIEEPETPFHMARHQEVEVTLTTGSTDITTWQMVAIYGGRAARVWDVVAEPYTPATPDVWELAANVTSYPYVNVPATMTNLHNDYTLPFPEIPEGNDAVYKLVIDQDQMISASVTYGENGKVALYTSDFNGQGGPMADNNYTGIVAGGASGQPFEAQIGEGTNTTGYFPFYSLYNYSIATALYTAAELEEAGATTAPMSSLSFYATNSISQDQNNIKIWMANVTDTEVNAASPLATGMTLVYEGNVANPTPTEWIEFAFNQGTFAWDGTSNVLILCQRNNGSWTSSIQWQAHNPGFYGMGYLYTDSAPYDVETTSYNLTRSQTARPNIIMKADRSRSRDITMLEEGFEGGVMPAGWTSEGDNEWTVGTGDYSSATGSNSGSYNALITHVTRNDETYLVTPAMDLSDATQATLNFSFVNRSWLGDIDEFGVYCRVNGGAWNELFYTTEAHAQWTPSGDIALPGLAANYQLGFKMVDNYGYGVGLDDIVVTCNGGGGGGDTPVVVNYSAGPVIENLPVVPGTYYLVASSTTPDFEVTINAENMPCPEVATNPVPADGEYEVEPARVTLRWQLDPYATEYRLRYGRTYYCEDVLVDWTSDLANSYTVSNLFNNTHYFWCIDQRNASCETTGEIWGFTTHLNIPQNLYAEDETIFNDESVVLHWTAVADRTYRTYNVYRSADGVNFEMIGSTQMNNINATTYTDGPLAYNIDGYTYYVTAFYDEGESAPSNMVNVKVSGRGNVEGHVYEQDGATGIAGATVTMQGQDEYGVSHTYTFTTNAQGAYSGAVYAGNYNGQAAKDGYQTITAPVQGNPIAITYNTTTSPVDYVLDENFDPVCAVIAQYYPDSTDINAPYVKVYWGCGLPGSEIVEPFETGDFSLFDWQIDPTYPWTITTNAPYEGTYCMKSGGAGVANVVSNMTVTVDIPADGLMSFFGKISCESSWDYGYFYIDGVQKGNYTGAGTWGERVFDITAGTHTFQWQYTKDGSVNSNDDCFYVDYITFYKQPAPAVPGMTYDFEDHTMQGWTSVDADGDGNGWRVGSEVMSGVAGHNGSADFVFSQSYDNSIGVLYPDNYLVSPQVQLGGIVQFYACAQDANYAAEHFGVAVSTTNTNPSSFTTVQEWTMSAKSVAAPAGKPVKESRSGRAQGNWYEYTVDLSAYSGMGYVAIRHFNCSDMFYLDVDDITIGEPGAKAGNDRAFAYYRIYRTNCYNDGPYTEENTVLLASEVTDTVYIDTYWPDVPAGVYKWGVGCVYMGNRGEEIEGPITWAAPMAVRDLTADNTTNPVAGETNGIRAPWDLMNTFYAAEAAQYGVVTDGQYIYTSNWGYASAAHNFYKYDMQGNMIEGFEIPGCGTLRGMTFDGQYVYGVANANTVYCVDLNNHTLIGSFTTPYGAMRCISYDPVRDGFWVVGNWSGNLTLIDRTGAIVTAGPAPSSASDVAYYKDENNVEHVYCFDNSNNMVWDYDIASNAIVGTVFDFSVTPGFDAGTSGGCHVGEYNGKVAFFGNLQQSPNLIGIYELRDGGSSPTPGPGGNNPIQEPRESEIVWSNCLDKDMYLTNADVTVLLNSADSPEGTVVTFTNYNEAEQAAYPIAPIVLDGTGYYAFDSFRRGVYQVTVEHEGYETIVDSINFLDYPNNLLTEMHLRYVMIEILYGVSNVYVSRTGWAMWDGADVPVNPTPGPGGNGDTFSYDFDNGMPAGWTTVDADGDGYTWVSSMTPGNYHNAGVDLTGTGHNASAHYVISGSWANGTGQVLYPDNYLVSPQVTLAAGSTFSFWACAQDASYPADHFGVAISDNGTSDWTMVNEWTMTAKGNGAMSYGRDGNNRAQGNWYNYTVDLSAYAGQKYIAIRHFNCSDQFILNVDDIELTAGAKDGGDRHLEYYKVLCTSIDGVPIYNHNTVHPFCQLTTDGAYVAALVEGDHYLCKVAAVYSTGTSAWSTPVEWVYEPCDHWGPVDEVTVGVNNQGNHIEWVFEHGFNPYGGDTPTPPAGSTSFTEGFEGGLNGWNVLTVLADGGQWIHSSNNLGGYDYTALAHGGTGFAMCYSFVDYVGAFNTDSYLITPQKYDIVNGSTLTFWADNANDSYPENFSVCVATADNPTAADFTTVWSGGAKGGSNAKAEVRHDANRYENWRSHSVNLSAYAGQSVWIAFHDVNYDMYEIWIDDVELTAGAKASYSAMESGMLSNGTYAFNITDIANFDERVYFLYNLNNNAQFDVINGEAAGMFIISAAAGYEDIDLEEAVKEFSFNTANQFNMMDKVQAAEVARAYKAQLPASFTNSMMMDIYAMSRDNALCADAYPFCTDEGMYEFPAGVNAGSGEPGPDYDCLYTTPNPAWYYMKMADPGDMDIYMYSTPSVDIDFCCWGPFADPISPCPNGLTSDKVVSCSYSAQPTEHCMIPASAQTGEYYILVITNYSNQACNINFSKVAGSGSTDCSIIPPAVVDIIGFLITQDGEFLAFAGPNDREYTDIDEFGQHEYCVRPIYPGEMTLPDHNYGWSMGCPVCEFGPEGPGCAPGAPIYGEALTETDQVKVWWGDQPAAPIEDWLYYDDGANVDAIGLTSGGSFYWGIKFPANTLGQYEDCSVTKIGYFDYTAHTGTVRIYNGSVGNAPGALIGTYNYTANGTEDWVEWNIPAVAFDNTQDLWIVMNNNDGQHVASVGNYTGDPNGTMISTDGNTWYTLEDATGGQITGTWNLRCFVTNQAKGGEVVVLEDQKNGTPNGVIANAGIGKQGHAPVYATAAEILKYNVYRSTDNDTYTMIGEVAAVAGQTYYEYIDSPATSGTYYYQVRADYGDCESDPAVSGIDPSVNYVVVFASVGLDENGSNVALFPNPTNGNVTIQAQGMSRITVVSVLGQVVYDTELNADEFTLNMAQFNAGMYMVRIYNENGVTVKRVTVMR